MCWEAAPLMTLVTAQHVLGIILCWPWPPQGVAVMLLQAKWIWPRCGHKYWRVIVHNCCNFGWWQLKLFWAMSQYFAAAGQASKQCWRNHISPTCVVICSPAPKAALMLSVGMSRDTLKETFPLPLVYVLSFLIYSTERENEQGSWLSLSPCSP